MVPSLACFESRLILTCPAATDILVPAGSRRFVDILKHARVPLSVWASGMMHWTYSGLVTSRLPLLMLSWVVHSRISQDRQNSTVLGEHTKGVTSPQVSLDAELLEGHNSLRRTGMPAHGGRLQSVPKG